MRRRDFSVRSREDRDMTRAAVQARMAEGKSPAFKPIISSYLMAKTRTQFICNHCGSVHPKWMGKCPDCGTWDALEEFKAPTPDARAQNNQTGNIAQGGEALTLAQIDESESARTPTGIGE